VNMSWTTTTHLSCVLVCQ